MHLVLTDAADTGSVAYQLGEATFWVILAAVVGGVIAFAIRRSRSEKVSAQANFEQRNLQMMEYNRLVPVRITHPDGRFEDLQIPFAHLPDLLLRVQYLPLGTVEARDAGKGIIRVQIRQGTATVGWENLGSSFRYLASNDPVGSDTRYRLSVGEAITVVHAWANNTSRPDRWERAQVDSPPVEAAGA